LSSFKLIYASLFYLLILSCGQHDLDPSISGKIICTRDVSDLTIILDQYLWRNSTDDSVKFDIDEELSFSSIISPGKYLLNVSDSSNELLKTYIIADKDAKIQIEFDLTEMPIKINVQGSDYYEEYNRLIKDLEKYDQNWRKIKSETRNANRNKWVVVSDSIRKTLNDIELKYNAYFKPIFTERKIYYLTYFHPISKDINTLYSNGEWNDKNIQLFYSSEVYQGYFNDMIKLLELLDFKSPLLSGKFFSGILRTHGASDIAPVLSQNLNLPNDYFYKLLKNASEVSPIMEIRVESLFKLAEHYIERGKFAEGRNSLERLQTNYSDASIVKNGEVKRLLASMKTTPGYVAPELNIQLITGENYHLSEQKGKFILVDFWATWCGACVDAIPHIINLSRTISSDSLQIIGIANDDSTRLANYIKEHKIDYLNACSDKEILDLWGIIEYPTTFMIDPEGKIYRKNINIGNNIVNEIRKLMAHYYSKNGV